MHKPSYNIISLFAKVYFSQSLPAIACRSSVQFAQFSAVRGGLLRFSAVQGNLRQLFVVYGSLVQFGVVEWRIVSHLYSKGELISWRYIYVRFTPSSIYNRYVSRPVPVICCDVSVHFHPILFGEITQKKLKCGHKVIFYIRYVARIYPEKILPSVEYLIWGFFGNISAVVLAEILPSIEFILSIMEIGACFQLFNIFWELFSYYRKQHRFILLFSHPVTILNQKI